MVKVRVNLTIRYFFIVVEVLFWASKNRKTFASAPVGRLDLDRYEFMFSLAYS